MRFPDYYKSLPFGGRRALAAEIGVAPTYLHQMGTSKKPVPTRLWKVIEQKSAGVVSVLDLLDADIATQDRAA